jgi:hypothetical protein
LLEDLLPIREANSNPSSFLNGWLGLLAGPVLEGLEGLGEVVEGAEVVSISETAGVDAIGVKPEGKPGVDEGKSCAVS